MSPSEGVHLILGNDPAPPQLFAEQHEDPEVSSIFSRSVSESEVSQKPHPLLYEEWSANEKVETT